MTKPDYKFMHVILNQCLRLNAKKAIFAVFMYFLMQFFLMMIAVSFVSLDSFATMLIAFCLLVGVNICSEMLLYGLFVIMARFVEKKYVTIGFLFIGFRKDQKRILKVALVFTLIYASITILVSVAYFFCRNYFFIFFENTDSNSFFSFAALIVVFLTMVFTIPFSFVRLILYRNDEMQVLLAFKKSVSLIKGLFFHFVGFILYACGKPLIQVIILQIVLLMFSASENSSASMQFLMTFMGIASIMAQYRTLTRFFISITIYYYTRCGVLHPHKTESASLSVSTENVLHDNKDE
ncbi:MAG: hypothetical protein IJ828_07885 [Treponema sp.]|nr:hypothetical protein [Treponema sp.]